MNRVVVVLALLLAPTLSALANDPLAIPPPDGMTEATAQIPLLRDQAMVGQADGNKVVGVYLLPDELASRLRGEDNDLTMYCRAWTIHEDYWQDKAQAYFQAVVGKTKRAFSKPFDPNSPPLQRMVAALDKQYGTSVDVSGSTYLGTIADSEDVIAGSMVGQMAAGTRQLNVVAAVGWVLKGTLNFQLSCGGPSNGQPSIERANKLLLSWITSIQHDR